MELPHCLISLLRWKFGFLVTTLAKSEQFVHPAWLAGKVGVGMILLSVIWLVSLFVG